MLKIDKNRQEAGVNFCLFHGNFFYRQPIRVLINTTLKSYFMFQLQKFIRAIRNHQT